MPMTLEAIIGHVRSQDRPGTHQAALLGEIERLRTEAQCLRDALELIRDAGGVNADWASRFAAAALHKRSHGRCDARSGQADASTITHPGAPTPADPLPWRTK